MSHDENKEEDVKGAKLKTNFKVFDSKQFDWLEEYKIFCLWVEGLRKHFRRCEFRSLKITVPRLPIHNLHRMELGHQDKLLLDDGERYYWDKPQNDFSLRISFCVEKVDIPMANCHLINMCENHWEGFVFYFRFYFKMPNSVNQNILRNLKQESYFVKSFIFLGHREWLHTSLIDISGTRCMKPLLRTRALMAETSIA